MSIKQLFTKAITISALFAGITFAETFSSVEVSTSNPYGPYPITRISGSEVKLNFQQYHTVIGNNKLYITNHEDTTSLKPDSIKTKEIVSKKIACEEIIVSHDAWADHVFAEGYSLSSLAEVESFINENGHLPGIPSEQDVIENGVNMGDMQVNLLRTVEEMTLRMIEMQKRIDELSKH